MLQQQRLAIVKGGYPSIRHNKLRDLTVRLLTETCSGIAIEPTLQPVSSERLRGASANMQDGVYLDIVARMARAFFDVRVFNPFVPSNSVQHLNHQLSARELEKAPL